jgi:hypothetical protein
MSGGLRSISDQTQHHHITLCLRFPGCEFDDGYCSVDCSRTDAHGRTVSCDGCIQLRNDDVRSGYHLITSSKKAKIEQIISQKTPFAYIPDGVLLTLVLDRRVRPLRPLQEDVPIMDDATWEVIEHCWTHEGSDRPTAREVATRLLAINQTVGGTSLQTPPVTPPMRFTRPKPLDLVEAGENRRMEALLHAHLGVSPMVFTHMRRVLIVL